MWLTHVLHKKGQCIRYVDPESSNMESLFWFFEDLSIPRKHKSNPHGIIHVTNINAYYLRILKSHEKSMNTTTLAG